MSLRERRKGARGEGEVAAIFRRHGFDCDRTPNSGGLRFKGDLAGDAPLHVEVKRQETLRLPLWTRQAQLDAGAGARWAVAYRASAQPWLAVVPLEQLVRLLELERAVLAIDRELHELPPDPALLVDRWDGLVTRFTAGEPL